MELWSHFERIEDQIWFPPKAVSGPNEVCQKLRGVKHLKCQKLRGMTVFLIRLEEYRMTTVVFVTCDKPLRFN